MSHYIPSTDIEKIAWLVRFTAWMVTNGVNHGFSQNDINDLTTVTNTATNTYTAHETAQDAAIGATAAKNNTLSTAIALARDDAQRLQVYPTTTDSDRGNAGITIPDTTPTATLEDKILAIPAPLLLLDFSVRRHVTIHWGPNPSNERQNGRPHGTLGCRIEYAKGGIPPLESGWTLLETDPDSPCIHTVHEEVATTYAYRACYIGKKLNSGAYGDPAVCTVSI